jgi:thioredoxin-like negative regulator of GroEL
VRTDRAFEDDAARKPMLETFDTLGPEDPIANDYRYQLQMALFV